MRVTVIGGGLAGSEAAFQIAERGVAVDLREMRPLVSTKAHKTGLLAELVCSNSLKGEGFDNAVGVLKDELRRLGSLILQSAEVARVPAGNALAVDRHVFSATIDARVRAHPRITVTHAECAEIPEPTPTNPVIIATGPLTSGALAQSIQRRTGTSSLAFYDAIAPIATLESLDLSRIFRQSRYGKGGEDYLNVPLNADEYMAFVRAVQAGEKFTGHEDVENAQEHLRPFEACMPIEDMVERGEHTLRFGPMKPVGLTDPRTGRYPFAAVQLRQDNREGTLWSMVGFQTRLKQPEQKRIFRLLPGMEQAEFVRLGSIHRNTFIDSPQVLNPDLTLRSTPGLFFAGQITGVEGYVESTAAGLLAGINATRFLNQQPPLRLPSDTALGSLLNYITDPSRKHFQPMNMNFGIMPSYTESEEAFKRRDKKERRLHVAERALQSLERFIQREVPDLVPLNTALP